MWSRVAVFETETHRGLGATMRAQKEPTCTGM